MAEFSKWLEAGEESIFSLETEKNLPGASYELREASARTKTFPEIKFVPTACSIPVWPFVVVVKAEQISPRSMSDRQRNRLRRRLCPAEWGDHRTPPVWT
jgi:hypothetical protein